MMASITVKDLVHFPGLAAFAGIRLWKPHVLDGEEPKGGEKYVLDWRSYDIRETMLGGIRNARAGCVAFTFCDRIRPLFGDMIEAEAAKRGATVLWWSGPGGEEGWN